MAGASRAKKRKRPSSQKKPRRPFVPSKEPRVRPEEVELIAGKTRRNAGQVCRLYWRIFHKGKRAGRAFIVVQEADSARPDASITVELNAASRGRGIGTVAFRKASELSSYDEVYASIAKSNIASRIAAERAGFSLLPESPSRELVMVWRRTEV